MKSPAYVFVALVLAVAFSLVAYRVSVHFASLPPELPVSGAPEAGQAPAVPPAGPSRLPPEQAQAAEAIARALPIQQAVDAWYRAKGTWPRNLAQLGLGLPDDHAGGPVASINVQPFGEVAVAMKPHVARGGVIRLTPQVQPDGRLQWHCRANNYAAATRLDACR